MTTLLRVERLAKSFNKFTAVAGVDFDVPEGQVTAIIGPNGAGKTTLINLLTGGLKPDSGRILFLGDDVTALSPNQRIRRGIGRSFQVVNIFPRLTVRDNIAIPVLAHIGYGLSYFRSRTRIPEVDAAVDQILHRVGLAAVAGQLAGELSHGDQRLLEIGLALATEPRLLVLDEPTSGLNVKERSQVLDQLVALARRRALTLVLIEHDMDIVFALADRIIVLHHGKVFAEGTPEQIQHDVRVQEIYLGTELEGASVGRDSVPLAAGAFLEVLAIDTYYGASHVLRGVSLQLQQGQVAALLGRNGVGKTTTLRSIIGLTPPARGALRLRGQDITGRRADEISALGVAHVPDDRRIFPDLTTLENLLFPTLVRRVVNGRWTVENIEEIFPPLGRLRDRKGRHLSGGEQKMLAIGRALMADPDLLLLDEPSEGLSPLMVQMLFDALLRIRQKDVTILLADQNLKFARAVADWAYILDKGAIAYTGSMQMLAEQEDVVRRYLAV